MILYYGIPKIPMMNSPCTYIVIMILTALLAACSDVGSKSASSELARAEEAFSQSDFASAMNIAASALDLPQTDSIVCARLYDIIAGCHRSAGNAEAELSYALQAAEWAPNDSLVRQELVLSAISASRHDIAMEQLKKMDSTDEFRLHMLPLPAMKTGHTDLARDALVHLYSNNLWMSVSQMAMLAEIYNSEGMQDRAATVIDGIDPTKLTEPDDLEAMLRYYDSTGDTQMSTLRL